MTDKGDDEPRVMELFRNVNWGRLPIIVIVLGFACSLLAMVLAFMAHKTGWALVNLTCCIVDAVCIYAILYYTRRE